MSIFDNDNDKLKELVIHLKGINKALYDYIDASHKGGFDLLWNNSNFTAQEILNEFGSDAVQLFILSKAIQQLLKAANPNYVALVPPKEYTINEDGTITIIESSESIEPSESSESEEV